MRNRYILTFALLLGWSTTALSQNTVNVSNADFAADTDYTWTADKEYLLTDMVFVKPGSRLFIEAGTIVRGDLGNGNDATGLVVARGAQIFAEGTPDRPIIFTSVVDDPIGTGTSADRGLWGGLVVLGAASTNNATEGGVKLVEGVNEIASPESLAEYGGTNDEDNSGVIRYVSIRHTGINVGDQAGNEIQGLTLGGVGSGTTIEYVESFASNDDGFEWFGGTVNTKYLVSAFNTDDAFDWDEGFRGKGQFWFSIQDNGSADGFGRAFEFDGATGDENTEPYGMGWVVNSTILGAGTDVTTNAGDGSQLMMLRDNTGGKFYNNIFADTWNTALTVEDIDNTGSKPLDSRQRLEAGDIVFENNLWFGFGAGNSAAGLSSQDFVQSYLTGAGTGNTLEDPSFRSISRTAGSGALDPRLAAGSPAMTGAVDVDDPFFTKVAYKGAFGSRNWLAGWTALDQLGYLAADTPSGTTVNISNADLAADTDYTWTADKEYLLTDMVFVKPGSRLFIEAGTIVRGDLGNGNDATGLVVARGAQIFAEGTPDRPIIFTSVVDDPIGTGTSADRGLWGGLVVLGAASTNNATEGGVKLVEGVNEIASPESLAEYGGTNDEDNSGVIRYVSIRHTGINVGDQAGNEIQGLTLGGVGSGTTIEYVESFASNDDGFEWFGGTVNTKYLVSAFNTDDAFDWDEGFRGKGQFWFSIQDNGSADGFGRAFEFDGATGDENTEPYGMGWVVNSTILGAGTDVTTNAGDGSQLMMLRDNTGGKFYNNIFADTWNTALTVEDIDNTGSKPLDSRQRLEAGDIVFENNLWFGFGAGNSAAGLSSQDFVQSYLTGAGTGNTLEDPSFRSISRTAGSGALDPRLAAGSPAMTGAVALEDPFFDAVAYLGAFGDRNWLAGWTALDNLGYTPEGSYVDIEEETALPTEIRLTQNYPNPFNPTTQIAFTLPAAQRVTLQVFDMSGRLVATLVDGMQPMGVNEVTFDASSLASGVYMYRLTGDGVSLLNKMTLLK